MMGKPLGPRQLEFLAAHRFPNSFRFKPTRTGRPHPVMLSLVRREPDLDRAAARGVLAALVQRMGRSKQGELDLWPDAGGPGSRGSRTSGPGMTAYYNENEPFAAAWLRNLIAAGHI